MFTFLSREKKVNEKPAPVTQQGEKPGEGIGRPYDVKFGPDGAMYIVDYGQNEINQARIAEGHLPFEWPEQTGAIWRVTKVNKQK